MMHHPNMHHQPMSGHPPQHMGGHQPMPGHHQMPPHQMHRENRHVTLTRVPLGPGPGPGPGGQQAGVHPPALVHHAQRPPPPHPIRAMPHHPPAPTQHHSVPPLKQLRRPYVGGGYGAGVMHPPYAQPPHMQPPPQPQPQQQPQPQPQPIHTVPPPTSAVAPHASTSPASGAAVAVAGAGSGGTLLGADASVDEAEGGAAGDSEAVRPPHGQANSKEKTPMCLVNELARYNKIKHQYRLTSETGPAHKKVFTVTLRLGDTEEYTAEGSSIKRAQHAAASSALGATSFPPPPPRAQPAHVAPHPHHRHAGAVMPTVELNALAMKLCQPAVYTSIPPVAAGGRVGRVGMGAGTYRVPFPGVGVGVGVGGFGRMVPPGLVYRVRVCVGGRAWLGEGGTPQAARHDAAARALHDLRPPAPPEHPPPPAQPDPENGDTNADLLNSEVKSPVSLVHELALKRNLSVSFSVKSERGPPHMRVFITLCTVGDMETEGEGNGKKVSKRRAAERMVEEIARRWPPALLRPRLACDKRRHQPAKKKPRNLIKEGGTPGGEGSCGAGADNPISRLAVARHAVRARSPQYRVLEERGAARRREFLVQCTAPPHSATGLGPNKKTAKRRAAHNVLLAMELSSNTDTAPSPTGSNTETNSNGSPDSNKNNNNDSKRKDSEGQTGGNGDVRQPVPGVLLMDYHQRSGQPQQPNSVSETSATGGTGGNTPGAKDQLMYLSQLLGFSVQFSDFPKRNHGEYLSLVSLSTEPPVMCHGGGPSTAHSHEQCARAALRALTLMGLDAPTTTTTTATATAATATSGSSTSLASLPSPGPKPAAAINGIAE